MTNESTTAKASAATGESSSRPAEHPELPGVPRAAVGADGRPQIGTYAGELPVVDFSGLRGAARLPPWRRPFKHKRWHYLAVATPQVLLAMAVVDATYAANGFAYAVDLERGRVLFDTSLIGLPGLQIDVNDHPGAGHTSRLEMPGARIYVQRGAGRKPYRVDLELSRLWTGGKGAVRARLQIEPAAQATPLTVIAPVRGENRHDGVVNVTQKFAALTCRGWLDVGSPARSARRFLLDGAIAGLDYTQGLLARRTCWRWALALGRLDDGTPVGINLVEGFNEDDPRVNENALWIGDRLVPLGRARFRYDRENPASPWHITTEPTEAGASVELSFRAFHVHDENRDLKFLTSYFVQPTGLFDATIRVGDEHHELEGMAGVTEDQDIRW